MIIAKFMRPGKALRHFCVLSLELAGAPPEIVDKFLIN
jgi:hypothetical protein